MSNTNNTVINFNKLETLMKDEDSQIEEINNFKLIIDKYYENDQVEDVFKKCKEYLNKYDDGFSNKELINKVYYELVRASNLIILSLLNGKDTSLIKPYIEVCEKSPINDFSLLLTYLNNKCCYLSKLSFNRNAVEIMTCLKNIYTLQNIHSLFIDSLIMNKLSLLNKANCCLQLCAFQSHIKEHNNSLLNGLQSLALNQLAQVQTIFTKKLRNIDDNSNNSKKTEIANDTSGSTNIIICYYNIGVQQENLKRVNLLIYLL